VNSNAFDLLFNLKALKSLLVCENYLQIRKISLIDPMVNLIAFTVILVTTTTAAVLVVTILSVIVCALLVRRGHVKCGCHSTGTDDVEATGPVDIPYAIPRPGRLWLGKSTLAAYDPQTVYTLPPGFRRNESLAETVGPPPAVDGRLFQKGGLRRLDSSDGNAPRRDAASSATVNSRLMPLDSLFRPQVARGSSPPHAAHLNRIPRPMLHIGVFGIGSGAVATADHDLSAEFFCSPPTPTDERGGSSGFGRNTLAPTASLPSSSSAIGSRPLHRSSFRPPPPLADVAPADFGNPFLPDTDGSPFDFLDEYASVGSSSSRDDDTQTNARLPRGTHMRTSAAASGADGFNPQRAPQDPATWPETPVGVQATINRTMRRTVSHDESMGQGPAAEGGVRMIPTLNRQRKNWNIDEHFSIGDFQCQRSNIDFRNIGARPEQRSTSAAATNAAADIEVIRETEDGAAGGKVHRSTTSNGHITAGEGVTPVSHAEEPDALFPRPDPIITLPVRFQMINLMKFLSNTP
jgi:hypothetical protein